MAGPVRVRFAPSPTGFMHLGNIRAALMNYLFAKQKGGTFVLRIEDTDEQRNVDEAGFKIVDDLKWLGLNYDEGPVVGGKLGPYIQSKRKSIYEKHLSDLIENQKVYRCFCTLGQLEAKKREQLAQGNPPRYDRTCRSLSDDQIKENLSKNMPFVWRLKINSDSIVKIESMARKTIEFEMKNFSDFAITRSDGSFTFVFANFIDDWLMQISHVIRGEDHLSNTAMQAALFEAFAVSLPKFWHLPMLCNVDGEKLSKRDFGFSLEDLKKEGILGEAICNYLALVGSTFKEEIQSLEELAQNFDFENLHSTGPIRFDIEKLLWVNHKWLSRLDASQVAERVKHFLHEAFVQSADIDDEKLTFLVSKVCKDVKTLHGVKNALRFYFEKPKIDMKLAEKEVGVDVAQKVLKLIVKNLEHVQNIDLFLNKLKEEGKSENLKVKEIFMILRYLLTGQFSGIGMHDLFKMLDVETIKERLSISV